MVVCAAAAVLGSLPAAAGSRILAHQALTATQPATARLQSGGTPAPERLEFEAFGRHFVVELPHNARLERLRRHSTVALLRGTLPGIAGSWARLASDGPRLTGMLSDGTTIYVIEPVADAMERLVQPAPDTVNLVYRLDDLLLPAGAMACDTARVPATATSGSDLLGVVAAETGAPGIPATARAAGASRRISLAAVADFEFFNRFGDNAEAQLLARINIVDGIYTDQLGLEIDVQDTEIFDAPDDPFEASDAEELLGEVSVYRRDAEQSGFGLTHLMTGRNLDGNTAGIAYIGSACTSRFAVALSEQPFDAVTGALTLAHEIGHNLDALHDGEPADPGDPPNPCDDVPETFLMAPRINQSQQFSQCSLDVINDYLDSPFAYCVTDAGPEAVVIEGAPGMLSGRVGQAVTLAFSISNDGGTTATGVAVSIGVPNGLDATPFGDCTTGAGTVECPVGTLRPGDSRSLSVGLEASADGSYDISLQARSDAEPAGDRRVVTLDVSSAATATSGSGGGGGGGGGGLGFLSLAVLAGAWRVRRASARQTRMPPAR